MKNNLKIIILILTMISTISGFSKNIKDADCETNFHKAGLTDFELGISLKDLSRKNPDLKLKFIQDDIEIYDDYVAKKGVKINGKEKLVTYYFNFKNNELVGYFFEINGNRKLFIDLSKKLSDQNFIDYNEKNKKYNFFQQNDNCSKYFRIKIKNDNIILTGGAELKSFD
jgi:hypothetical protein